MKAVVQRVTRASVTIDGESVAAIGPGMLILLGVASGDGRDSAISLARRCFNLRIFRDSQQRMNNPVSAVGGAVLVVSQFTLLGDTSKGRRPGYSAAAQPAAAEPLYQAFCEELESLGAKVSTGEFGADMEVELVNDGPVTLIVESG